MTMAWKQLDAAKYSDFRAERLRVRGGEVQREFLETVRNDEGSKFVEIVGSITTHEGEDLSLLQFPFSEGEFVNPPFQTEKRMYQIWSDLSPAEASSSSFWAHVTIQHLKFQRIWPSYLACSGSSGKSGQERIERALKSNDEERAKYIDDCVRTIFRQMGGLPEIRGNRSVFVDCPLARGWWRQYLVSRAAKCKSNLKDTTVGRVVRESKGHWERFVAAMVSRNPVFGLEQVQDAFLISLSHIGQKIEDSKGKKITSDEVQNLCQRFCFTGGSKELGAFSFHEVLNMAMELLPETTTEHRSEKS